VREDGGSLGPADLSGYRVHELPVVEAEIAGTTVLGRRDLNQTMATLRGLPAEIVTMSPRERAVCMAKLLSGGARDGLGDTTNVTAVDERGNACVVTTTLGLGAGLWLPGYGVHLNSMLGEGELRVGASEPGDRIGSMMCPLVAVSEQGSLVLAVGSAGASRIRSALMRTIVGVLVEGMTVPEAVAAPRLHPADSVVHIEPHLPADQADAMREAGFDVNRWPDTNHYFGGVSAVGVSGCAGDPRRDGHGASVIN
jgi:gamma-glutamyltranspeptidase / glutathione hydrolase